MDDSGEERPIVLKKVKDRVTGAAEMQIMEHLLNVHTSSSSCRRAVAPFIGYIDMEQSRGRLTKGLWLLWDYEGDRTLAYYLRRRDCLSALAADLEVPEEIVIPTVMRQIFENLVDLHSCGIVHRDIKPANIVLSEEQRRFKLIDLGAAADLRTGTNYTPDSTILDPLYCPPEEYILPTDAPHLAETASPLAMVISPYLWQQHRPDCFDTFSAGVILLQLGLPFMRSQSTLKNWRGTFARCGYDLEEWRSLASLSSRQTALLDADDNAGWDIAAGLLRPRKVDFDGDGIVRFINTGKAPRLTAQAALRHRYLKSAARYQSEGGSLGVMSIGSLFSSLSSTDTVDEPIEASEAISDEGRYRERSAYSKKKSKQRKVEEEAVASKKTGSEKNRDTNRIKSTWHWFKDRLFDLEARVNRDVSATQTQTAIVEQLKADVAAGKASKADLEKEEGILRRMKKTLQSSVGELNNAYKSAAGFVSSALSYSAGDSPSSYGSKKELKLEDPSKATASSRASPSKAAIKAAVPVEEESKQKEEAEESNNPAGGITEAVTGVATSAVYSGLKLTGFALNAVADMAAAAERGMARAREKAQAQKAATRKLVSVLQELDPPLGPGSTWESVEPLLGGVEGFEVLSTRQKKLTVETYVEAIQEKVKAEKAKAKSIASRKSIEDSVAQVDSGREKPVQASASSLQKPEMANGVAKEEMALRRSIDETSKGDVDENVGKMDRLEDILAEQKRLKAEYERMQKKMLQMQQALESSGLANSIFKGEMEMLANDKDGSLTFKFSSDDEENCRKEVVDGEAREK